MLAAVLLSPASAVGTDRASIPGTTMMSVDQSGWAPVRLTERLRVFPAEEPNGASLAKMRVTARGRLRAALLRAEQPNLADGKRAEWWTYNYEEATASSANIDVLPPGDYRLHAFVDQPARLDLRAPGLTGDLVLKPSANETVAMGPLALRPGSGPQTLIFGDSTSLAVNTSRTGRAHLARGIRARSKRYRDAYVPFSESLDCSIGMATRTYREVCLALSQYGPRGRTRLLARGRRQVKD